MSKKKGDDPLPDLYSLINLYSKENNKYNLKNYYDPKIYFKKEEYIKNYDDIFEKKINKYQNGLEDLITNLSSNYITKNYNKNIINKVNISYSGINVGLNKKLYSAQYGNTFGNDFLDDVIGARNISEVVLPIVDYIHATRPDMVIACDRGARFIGLATSMMYAGLHGRLPTTDGTIRFRKLTKNNSREQNLETLKPLVYEALAKNKNPTLLFLDDWVATGATQRVIRDLVSEISQGQADVKFGVLLGDNADISGDRHKGTSGFRGTVEWHDQPQITGVDYVNGKPRVLRTAESLEFRHAMAKSIEEHVARIKGQSTATKKKKKASTDIDLSDPFFKKFEQAAASV